MKKTQKLSVKAKCPNCNSVSNHTLVAPGVYRCSICGKLSTKKK